MLGSSGYVCGWVRVVFVWFAVGKLLVVRICFMFVFIVV